MNPLDDLPFDINSLRANSEFNWDCVDGIDQIHKDILKVYERAILAAITPLDRVNANVQAVGQNIANYAAQVIGTVANGIDSIDNGIVNNLNNNLNPLTTQYGNPGSTQLYYVVYRQLQCGNWFGVVEPWVTPPNNRTHYGPYKSECALSLALKNLMPQLTGMPVMLPFDEAVKAQIDLGYNQAVAAQGGENDNCNPDELWQYNKDNPAYKEVADTDCGNQGTPTQDDTSSNTVYQNGAMFDCEQFSSRQWVNHGQLPKLFVDIDPDGTFGPYWLSDDHFYLNGADYQSKVLLCNPTPNQPPNQISCLPCPQPTNTGIAENTTTTALNVTNSSTTTTTTNTQGTTESNTAIVDPDCCDAIATALQQIAIQLGATPQSVGSTSEDVAIANGMGDDAYNLSPAVQPAVESFLERLGQDYQLGSQQTNLLAIFQQQMAFLNTPRSMDNL